MDKDAHPDEDQLRRFLNNEMEELERTVIRSHLLACEDCLCRFEDLDAGSSD